MRSNIKKKVRIFLENELLVENKLISFLYDNYNSDPIIVENMKMIMT
ncbi:MAG TPA: hypothetical protein VLA74_04155 [Nitrososphaeraceae archaeon]|nr:hypothetical protein [Nitrososphaeraceae archaeon]